MEQPAESVAPAHRTWLALAGDVLELQAPDPGTGLTLVGEDRRSSVYRRDLLGGWLHEYRRAA